METISVKILSDRNFLPEEPEVGNFHESENSHDYPWPSEEEWYEDEDEDEEWIEEQSNFRFPD